MRTRTRSSCVAALAALLCACSGVAVNSVTPAEQLPDLIVPDAIANKDRRTGADRQEPPRIDDSAGVAQNEPVETYEEPAPVDTRPPQRQPLTMPGDRFATPGLVTAAPQPSSYALVIGIEKYRDVAPATGARRDAERFAEMARTTLGVPDDHVRLLLDDRASKTDIAKQLRWLTTNVPAGGRIYLYFSGHGAPDPTTGVSYIVPYDGDPQYLGESAIKMTQILGDLEKTRAKDVLAIADSCFSGAGGRSVLAPGTRPLVFVEAVKTTARVALLSASSGVQISGPTADGKGGLFSKHLMDALGSGQADMDGDAQISLKELDEWIRPRVEREAKKANREQTPTVQVGKKLGAPADFIVAWGYAR